MKYRVHVEAMAIADAEHYRSRLEESSEQAAERFLDAMEEAIESLAELPKRYPLAPERRRTIARFDSCLWAGTGFSMSFWMMSYEFCAFDMHPNRLWIPAR